MIKITVKRLFQLFRGQNNNVTIGRWNLDYDQTIQNRKVYWANMDNCGCCDVKKIDNLNKKIEQRRGCKREESEEYILP
jgi:hypothetical protein